MRESVKLRVSHRAFGEGGEPDWYVRHALLGGGNLLCSTRLHEF